jgi:hypothetical protein
MGFFARLLGLGSRRSAPPVQWLDEWRELDDRGNFGEAAEFIRSRLPAIEQVHGSTSEELASALIMLTVTLGQAGRAATPDFRIVVTRALELESRLRGPETLVAAMHLESLARSFLAARDERSAEPLLRRRLQIWENHHGPDAAKLVESLSDLAFVRARLGDKAEATRLLERAVGLLERCNGLESPSLLPLLEALAVEIRESGNPREALNVCRRIISIQEKNFGPLSNELAMTLGKYSLWLRDAPGVDSEVLENWFARSVTILSEKPQEQLPPELRARLRKSPVTDDAR